MNRLSNWVSQVIVLLFMLSLGRVGCTQTALVLRGGINLNKPTGATSLNFGLHGGIGLSIPLIKVWKLYVQPEVAYTQKGYTTFGFSYFGHPPTPERLFNVRMGYTEFPLLLRKEFRVSPSTRFYLLIGSSLWSSFRKIHLTYTVDGRRKDRNEFGTTVDWLQSEMARNTTPIDVALNAGTGFNVHVGRNRLGLEARYSKGTRRMGASHPGYHQTFSLSTTYFLNLSKP